METVHFVRPLHHTVAPGPIERGQRKTAPTAEDGGTERQGADVVSLRSCWQSMEVYAEAVFVGTAHRERLGFCEIALPRLDSARLGRCSGKTFGPPASSEWASHRSDKINQCRVLRDVIPPTPPGPEGSNGNGLVRAQ